MKRRAFASLTLSLAAASASAQSTGPGVGAPAGTVAKLRSARLGSYVTVTGNIVAHSRQNDFMFRDTTGEMGVEIEPTLR